MYTCDFVVEIMINLSFNNYRQVVELAGLMILTLYGT